MKRAIFLAILILASTYFTAAQAPFRAVSSEKRTVRKNDVAELQRSATVGKIDGANLSFDGSDIHLVVTTGPEDDMLSFRIQGLRNPNLIVPSGAKLTFLFINTDGDMRHDLRMGSVDTSFPLTPSVANTLGTSRLEPMDEDADATMQAEQFVAQAVVNGSYKYFCSVRGHAKGGMWGNLFIGIVPKADVKAPARSVQVPKPSENPSENNMRGMQGMETTGDTTMRTTSVVNVADPMSREGSGTSWVPESSPIFANMKMFSDGSMLMFHGTVFLRYVAIGSDRDASIAGKGSRGRVDAPSMFMMMYSKPVGKNAQLGLRTMLSLDPLIERGFGYPLLFQSGESYRGQPLHDRQHPHDFISELAATYSYKFDENNSVFFYLGYPGEPALGPVMYLHRPSAMNNPDAPIGHHWQDSSHISFGVLTAGYTYDKLKFEMSAFNGTEPDENRWAFDSPKLDSFAARLSFSPTKAWSFQISHGYLRDPERLEPEIRILRRTTASAMYDRSFNKDRNWSNSFVWGLNDSVDGRSNAFLFESDFEFDNNAIFGRAEQVQKSYHDLVLQTPQNAGTFWLQSYSAGYVRDVVKDKGIDVGVGTMATIDLNPAEISAYYGGTKHAGWQAFIRFRPSRMTH